MSIGTSFSCFAKFENGKAEPLKGKGTSSYSIPSAIYLEKDNESLLLGETAVNNRYENPTRFLDQFKRGFGLSYGNFTIGDFGEEITLSSEKIYEEFFSYIETGCNLIKQIVKSAGLKLSDLNKILLVGGSSRIPLVKNKIQELTGITPISVEDPELAVCMGAAMKHYIDYEKAKKEEEDRRRKEEEEKRRLAEIQDRINNPKLAKNFRPEKFDKFFRQNPGLPAKVKENIGNVPDISCMGLYVGEYISYEISYEEMNQYRYVIKVKDMTQKMWNVVIKGYGDVLGKQGYDFVPPSGVRFKKKSDNKMIGIEPQIDKNKCGIIIVYYDLKKYEEHNKRTDDTPKNDKIVAPTPLPPSPKGYSKIQFVTRNNEAFNGGNIGINGKIFPFKGEPIIITVPTGTHIATIMPGRDYAGYATEKITIDTQRDEKCTIEVIVPSGGVSNIQVRYHKYFLVGETQVLTKNIHTLDGTTVNSNSSDNRPKPPKPEPPKPPVLPTIKEDGRRDRPTPPPKPPAPPRPPVPPSAPPKPPAPPVPPSASVNNSQSFPVRIKISGASKPSTVKINKFINPLGSAILKSGFHIEIDGKLFDLTKNETTINLPPGRHHARFFYTQNVAFKEGYKTETDFEVTRATTVEFITPLFVVSDSEVRVYATLG